MEFFQEAGAAMKLRKSSRYSVKVFIKRLIASVIISLFAVSCGGGGGPSGGSDAGGNGGGGGISLSLVKKVTLTTDTEGGSARPEIVATQNRVFVVYLANIGQGSSRTFNVKIFDSNLDNLITSKTIVTTTTEYGSPTDIRVTSDGQYLYAFYETAKTTSQTSTTTHLWGAKYILDDSFNRVAYTATPITSSKPKSQLSDGGEMVDDPAPLIGPSSVFVITRLKYTLATNGNTIYRVREFTKDNLTKKPEFDLDLSTVADGQGRVTSLLYWNNNIYIALATTVSDQGMNEETDDGALSDIILVKITQGWTFDSKDVQTLSAEPNDRENYVSGFKTDGSYFFIIHKQAVGSPPTGEQIAWIKIFDRDFNLVLKEKVKSVTWGSGGGEIRPSLEVMGNRIFSGQSAGSGIGAGNAEVYVYERK